MRSIITFAVLTLLSPTVAPAQVPVTVETDVIYSRALGSAVLADIAYPVDGEGLPVIMYVHGGRWRAGQRVNDAGLQVAEWAGRGFFAMTIDYRLVGATLAPAAYQDVQTAIRWVHAHADEYRIDQDRIYLIGNSSGGYLVALVATLGEGPYDLNSLSWGDLWTPVEGAAREARRIASPIHNIGPGTSRSSSCTPMTIAPCRSSRP